MDEIVLKILLPFILIFRLALDPSVNFLESNQRDADPLPLYIIKSAGSATGCHLSNQDTVRLDMQMLGHGFILSGAGSAA